MGSDALGDILYWLHWDWVISVTQHIFTVFKWISYPINTHRNNRCYSTTRLKFQQGVIASQIRHAHSYREQSASLHRFDLKVHVHTLPSRSLIVAKWYHSVNLNVIISEFRLVMGDLKFLWISGSMIPSLSLNFLIYKVGITIVCRVI